MIDRSVLEGSAPDVAPTLLNKLLVSEVAGHRVVGRVTEVEAYDENDPASHTFGGRTDRNAAMFGAPGHLYVYLSYGIHHCANVVCGPLGSGAAVLIRAIEVIEGMPVVRDRRGNRPERELTNGPGKVCQALAIGLREYGIDLCDPTSIVRLVDDGLEPPVAPMIGPRVGISKAVDTPWRFRVATT